MKAGAIDLTMRIALSMHRLGISGLPRNHELVYEANAGSNPALSRELLALGINPSQAQLDELGRKYLAHHHGEGIVADAQSRISSNIEECLRLLSEEQGKLEDYGRTLHQASDEMDRTDALKVDIIRSFIRILTAATDTTISDSRQTIRTMVERSTEIERVRTELNQYKRMAHTDVLTQLANRRAFDDMLARIYDDGTGSYFSLVIADIDHFKRINDTFGHPVGDKIIKLVGSLFRAALRRDVFIARTGGEEFAFILAGTTAEETQSIANRIRATVDRTPFVNQRTGADYGPVTISMGACMAADAENAEDLYRKADAALYASKNTGRNRVTLHRSAANGELSDARIMYRRESA
jgi:diguanylate cyclase